MRILGRWLLLGGIAVVLVLLGWGGYDQYYRYTHGIETVLKRIETAYAEGLRAFDSKDFEKAAVRFDEAVLQANNNLEECAKANAKLDDKPQEEVDKVHEVTGRTYWLKARALRGQAMTELALAGKPLPTGADTTSSETSSMSLVQIGYRRIENKDLRVGAITSLRLAADLMPDNLELQSETLAMDSAAEPPTWISVKALAANILERDPADARARFLMARFDFEQPTPTTNPRENWKSTPPAKKSKERILKARQHLAELRKVERPLRWQAVYLDAQLHQWMIDYYRGSLHSNSTDRLHEELALRALLFDEDQGAIRRADQEIRLAKLSRLDLQAMLELHKLAIDKVIAGRKPGQDADATTNGQVLKILDATMALCKRFASQEGANTLQLGVLADTAVNAAATAQPFLAKDYAVEWARYIDTAQLLAQKAAERSAGTPALYENVVELLTREAKYRGITGDTSRQEELRAQAIKWADEGIRVAEATKAPAHQVLALHDHAARLKVASLGKRDAVEPHLKVLRESRSPTAQATAALLEGAFAEREGRLEKARASLEQSLRLTGGASARRAHLILGHIYLALGQPDKALASFREVEQFTSQVAQLSDEERAWSKEYLRDPAELIYLEMQAQLMGARMMYQAAIKRELTEQQAKQIREAIMAEEESAEKLLPKLARTPYARGARHLLVGYYTATDRPTMARRELDGLRDEYPGSLQVLKQEVELITKPPKGAVADAQKLAIEKADKRIQDFIATYPANASARLYWVQWLASTGRTPQAAAYLEDGTNFPGAANNPQLKQVLAVLQLNLGGQDRIRQLAAELPSGEIADRIAVLVSGVDGQEKLAGALSRYENNGFFRCYSAGLDFAKGDYVAAAKGYSQALEYTQVRDAARVGLGNALLALAQSDAGKGRELAGTLLRDYPRERNVLLAYAYACMLLDDLGDPQKPARQPEDMISALGVFEDVALQEGDSSTAGPLVKAQFWLMVGRPDRAMSETVRALQRNPKHEGALLLAARLYLESQEVGALVTGQKHLETLRTINPKSLQAGLLQARYYEVGGRVPEAVRAYETLIEMHPTTASAYNSLVTLLEKQGERDRAAKVVAEWRGKIPDDLNAAAAHVRQLAVAGKLDDAQKAAEQTVEEQIRVAADRLGDARSSDPMQQELRGRILDGARMAAQIAVSGAFTQAKAYDQAASWVEIVLKSQPDSIPANLLLGNIYLERLRGETVPAQRKAWAQKAHDAYAKVYTLQRGHAVAGNNLAWLLATELNDADKALTIAREVRTHQLSKRLRSGDELPVELLDTFGAITKNLTKPEAYSEMTDLFEKALKRYASDPRMYLHLGRAYAGQKNKTKANESFANAISVSKTKSTLPAAERQSVIQEAEQEQKKLGLPNVGTKPPVDF
jgi:Tfp pilus assembly protein PilF